MNAKRQAYRYLPDKVKPIAKAVYNQFFDQRSKSSNKNFSSIFFDNDAEFNRLSSEVNRSDVSELVGNAIKEHSALTAERAFGSVDLEIGAAWYALVRKMRPSTIIETGVCNGVSTFFILKALDENGTGHLHSVDYPYRADESLDEFRDETFERYGGAAIPSDKEPGWIIPEGLRGRWDLITGKSQVQLPPLLEEEQDIDLFIHDSEHSHPCMMFEYEIAWHKMHKGGVILSDDITWNDAFEVFCDVRDPVWGTMSENEHVGFMVKP